LIRVRRVRTVVGAVDESVQVVVIYFVDGNRGPGGIVAVIVQAIAELGRSWMYGRVGIIAVRRG
jgi:hypothetical protein